MKRLIGWRLASVNGIRDSWSDYDCWLASADDILKGWSGCV